MQNLEKDGFKLFTMLQYAMAQGWSDLSTAITKVIEAKNPNPYWYMESPAIPSHHKSVLAMWQLTLWPSKEGLSRRAMIMLESAVPPEWERSSGSQYQNLMLELICQVVSGHMFPEFDELSFDQTISEIFVNPPRRTGAIVASLEQGRVAALKDSLIAAAAAIRTYGYEAAEKKSEHVRKIKTVTWKKFQKDLGTYLNPVFGSPTILDMLCDKVVAGKVDISERSPFAANLTTTQLALAAESIAGFVESPAELKRAHGGSNVAPTAPRRDLFTEPASASQLRAARSNARDGVDHPQQQPRKTTGTGSETPQAVRALRDACERLRNNPVDDPLVDVTKRYGIAMTKTSQIRPPAAVSWNGDFDNAGGEETDDVVELLQSALAPRPTHTNGAEKKRKRQASEDEDEIDEASRGKRGKTAIADFQHHPLSNLDTPSEDFTDLPPLNKKGKRKKVLWTQAEQDALIEGVKMYGTGNWAAIRTQFAEIFDPNMRRPADLKDKYRVLQRQALRELELMGD